MTIAFAASGPPNRCDLHSFFVELHAKPLQIRYRNFLRANSEGIIETISVKVFEHHKKSDDTYNVKISIHHNDQEGISTPIITWSKNTPPENSELRIHLIADKVEQQLRDYRKEISELGDKLDYFLLRKP